MDKIKQYIDDYRCSGDDYYLNQALAYSAAALKLQQPMPVMVVVKDVKLLHRLWHSEYHPDAYYERNARYHCQNCGSLLGDELFCPPSKINYCPNCGQKLWWNK